MSHSSFSNICRACKFHNSTFFKIFNQSSENSVQISTMFSSISTLNIDPNDQLPDLICPNCYSILLRAYEFQQMCINSDKEMRSELARIPGINECQAFNEPFKEDPPEENSTFMHDGQEGETFDATSSCIKGEENVTFENASGGKSSIEIIKETLVSESLLKKPRHICKICNRQWRTESSFYRHMKTHGVKTEDNSQEQPKITNPLYEDSNMCDIEVKLERNEYSEEFKNQDFAAPKLEKRDHHSENKRYSCDSCPKTFSQLNVLTRHRKTHGETRNFQCNKCDRTFLLQVQLDEHLNCHNGLRPHVCPICHKGFQQSCTLKDHIRTHNGETPFLCPECGKAFNNSSNLRQHLLRHSGVKPFACPECPSRFTTKGGLKSHMTTHSNEKPFRCDQCDAKFTKPYSLSKHKRIHTGERPYSCEVCSMRFNSNDHVKRHMRTHTGEKPYSCKFCDRTFAQSNDLVKHMRSHVGEKTYACQECPEAFRLNSELRAHMREHFKQHKRDVVYADMKSNLQDSDTTLDSATEFQDLRKVHAREYL